MLPSRDAATGEDLLVPRIRCRPAVFNVIDSERIQFPGNHQYVFHRERHAFALRAVPESHIEREDLHNCPRWLVFVRCLVGFQKVRWRRAATVGGARIITSYRGRTRAGPETAGAAEDQRRKWTLGKPAVDVGKSVQQTSVFCTVPVRFLTSAPLSLQLTQRCATT